MSLLSPSAERALTRALRDLDDGHLSVFRDRLTGEDYADRGVAGAPERWWEILAERGELVPPPAGGGQWMRPQAALAWARLCERAASGQA